MRKRYSRSYTVLSFLTMFSYRELPFGGRFCHFSPFWGKKQEGFRGEEEGKE